MPDGNQSDSVDCDLIAVSEITDRAIVVGAADEDSEIFEEFGRLVANLNLQVDSEPSQLERDLVAGLLLIGVLLVLYGFVSPGRGYWALFLGAIISFLCSPVLLFSEFERYMTKKKKTNTIYEIKDILEYVECLPLQLLRNDLEPERTDVLVELLDEFVGCISELDSRVEKEEILTHVKCKTAQVTNQLGTAYINHGDFRMAVEAFSIAERATKLLNNSDVNDLPNVDRNINERYEGVVSRYVQAGLQAMDASDYECAFEAYESAVQHRPAYDIDDESVSALRDRAWRGRANAYLQVANQRIEDANARIKEEEYMAAVEDYQSVIYYLAEKKHVLEDEVIQEQRERQKELKNRARKGHLEAYIQFGKQQLEDAIARLENEDYDVARRRFQSIIDQFEKSDLSSIRVDEVVRKHYDRLKDVEDRARQGCAEVRIQNGQQQLEDATTSFEQGEYEAAASSFDSAIKCFENVDVSGVDIDDGRVSEAITTAERGAHRAKIAQERKELAAATSRLEQGFHNEARNQFVEVRERLEELRSSAEGQELTDEVETIEWLLEDCEVGIDSALRGTAGVDTGLDVEFDASQAEPPGVAPPDDVLQIEGIEQLEIDLDIPSVPEDVSRPAGSLVESDLLTELPDREEMELVGRGGTAQVYKLTPQDGSEPVAIKVPLWRGDRTLDRAAMEEFVREARIWNRIDGDEHVVEIQQVGTEPYPWIQMEYMDAGTLADRVGDVGLEEAVNLLTVLCETIGEVHQNRGVAHADLKPSNILFRTGPDGTERVKVADWGTARVLIEHSKSMEELTPNYAAPEQVNSDRFGRVDSNTDIYQLGVVAYELLTGRVPFDYEEPGEVTRVIQEEEPPPPSSVVDLPSEVDEVIQKALNKEKGERYESLRYFRDGLQGVVE